MSTLVLLLGATFFCLTGLAATAATEAIRMMEFPFESAKPYQDPFNEITLAAVFTDPSGGMRRVPAFWASGTTWRVRYASSIIGLHRFQTECSDPSNAGLHGQARRLVLRLRVPGPGRIQPGKPRDGGTMKADPMAG